MNNDSKIPSNPEVGILSEKTIDFFLHGEFTGNDQVKIREGNYKVTISGNEMTMLDANKKNIFSGKSIILHPVEPARSHFRLNRVKIGRDFHWERHQKAHFRGGLKFLYTQRTIHAINIIDIEEYLKSVISSEMNANSPVEFLKAHAVISRSWLVAQIKKRLSQAKTAKVPKKNISKEPQSEHIKWYDREDHKLYDVCADDHCQRYQGITKITSDKINQVIDETAGQVLTYNGQICDTRFSKCCGGMSEAFQYAWEPRHFHYLSPVRDNNDESGEKKWNLQDEQQFRSWVQNNPPAFCNWSDTDELKKILPDFDLETTDFFRWEVEYDAEELTEIFRQKTGLDIGLIKGFRPVERGYSGRLSKLEIIGSKTNIVIGKELEIRKSLSKSHLYSSAFIVEQDNPVSPEKFILKGAGWGHGVGLCQIGAARMASLGYTCEQILLHYYRGTEIKFIL